MLMYGSGNRSLVAEVGSRNEVSSGKLQKLQKWEYRSKDGSTYSQPVYHKSFLLQFLPTHLPTDNTTNNPIK